MGDWSFLRLKLGRSETLKETLKKRAGKEALGSSSTFSKS
jgi:hypothetical protein